jgi:hypothetical protein
VETYYFTGNDCSTQSTTALQTIEAGGYAYYAEPVVLTGVQTVVTFHYSSLVLSVLATVGPTIEFVCPF